MLLSMRNFQVLINPGNQMILKRPFDHLMEEVSRYQFIDVGAREIICKRLKMRHLAVYNVDRRLDYLQ